MGMRVRSILDLANSGTQAGEEITGKEEAYRRILEIVLKGNLEGSSCLNEQ